MTKRQERIFTFIGIVIIIALSIGLIKLNLKYKEDNKAEAEKLEIEAKEDKKINIPPIKVPEDTKNTQVDHKNKVEDDNPNYPDVPEYKEEVIEKGKNKVLIKSTPAPKKEKTPEGMKKPESKPKPKEPPKLAKDADTKNPEKPPTYEKQEDKSVDNLNNQLKPAENVTIIKGSDLLDDGEVAGEGDKF